MTTEPTIDLAFIDQSIATRARQRRRRALASLGVPLTVTASWLVVMTAGDLWDRIADHAGAAVTMVFGSFVAGSTPQGGGAVAFPVFTKVLDVPSSVARTFSLCIQAIGMGSAALVIVVGRRRVVWRAIAIAAPAAVTGFLLTAILASDRSTPFWEAKLPGPYVKITFTLVLAGMAWLVFLGSRVPVRRVDFELPSGNRRVDGALVLGGVLGGAASALVGSGADVLLYLVVVVLFGIDPRVGVPTSLVVMATVSVVGAVVLGVIDGQLATTVVDGSVVEVGGQAIEPLPVREADVLGMWLAAIPVVAWGAPLGSWVASRLTARQLVTFVVALAGAEIVSTAIFVDELRSDWLLLAYAVLGLGIVITGLQWLTNHRQDLFDLPRFATDETLRRSSVDVVPGYANHLATTDGATVTDDPSGEAT